MIAKSDEPDSKVVIGAAATATVPDGDSSVDALTKGAKKLPETCRKALVCSQLVGISRCVDCDVGNEGASKNVDRTIRCLRP